METITRVHPETGKILRRDIRPFKISYKGESITIDMPGWYPFDDDEGIFTWEDMDISDAAFKILKERVAKREQANMEEKLA